MADPTVLENAYVAFTTATGSSTYTAVAGVKSITLPVSRAELDDAVMGDTIEAKYPGVLSVPVSLVLRQDFTTAAAGVDKLVYTRLSGRTAFRMKVRPVNSSVSSTNPSIILNRVRIHNSSPIDGKFGDALENKVELRPQSGCSYSRSTST